MSLLGRRGDPGHDSIFLCSSSLQNVLVAVILLAVLILRKASKQILGKVVSK